ncbi:hypothetical protein C7M84_017518 [Penaeus vannamei]|uniref:Uncharacterized protein n=1 Tax=Penaeus vannamei TaxID=6689 RepID=A0A3R7PZJ8_PENVA|nr:hypothetical protein C7M84_017518 [Penaeus vannamei]
MDIYGVGSMVNLRVRSMVSGLRAGFIYVTSGSVGSMVSVLGQWVEWVEWRGPREEYITDDKDDTDDSEVIHARLDFLWRAVRCPVDVFNDASPLLLAHALAREPAASVKLFTSLERDGYDQWGALHGMVTIKDSPEEWYLRGCRQHRWGISETVANFYRSVDIFSYFNSGEVCSLQAFSYSSGLSHYVIGYVQEASGRYRPVTSTTLSLPHLAEKAPLPKNILTRFTIPERECLPALVEPRVEIDEATAFVVPLIDHRTRATCLTGGKASSLAFLMSLKDITDDEYEVPDGVVVTVAAWRQQLRTYPELQTAVRGVEKAVGCSQQAQLKDACARAVESFRSTPVCPKVAEALRQTLEETFEQNYQSRRPYSLLSGREVDFLAESSREWHDASRSLMETDKPASQEPSIVLELVWSQARGP